jgi:menaquinone-dependent protoporphyrinogen oxidase
MTTRNISRRQFLTWACGALGAGTLVCGGLTSAAAGLFDETPPMPSMPDITYGGKLMKDKILVTYASQAGSTAGVADAIGRSLSSGGATVDVRPMTAVDNPSPYRAVVLGSAVHSGKWLPEAEAFVRQNRTALKCIPTAIFQVCMMMATGSDQYRQMASGWMDPLRGQISPVAAASFSGALWPKQYPKITERLGLGIFLLTIKLKAGDYRDWNGIQKWAADLSLLLNQ